VCIKGRWSGWIRVWSRVPQGSVLGSVLFLVFINDLDQGIARNILKFADDTKIFKEVRVRDNIDCAALQRDLDNVVLWAQKWQMAKVKLCMLGDRLIVASTTWEEVS